MKILITGFDPFGTETVNPSSEAVALMKAPEGVELIKETGIPTIYGVGELVCRMIAENRPDAVICVGQAGGRRAVTVERIAINLTDSPAPDNAGFVHTDEPILPGGENALFTTLPNKKIVKAILDAGIPGEISNTAGTFVCNDVLYTVLAYIRQHSLPVMAGFIHVPFLPSQAEAYPGFFSLPPEQMAAALEAAVKAIADA